MGYNPPIAEEPTTRSRRRLGPRALVAIGVALVVAAELTAGALGFGSARIVEPSERLGHRLFPGQTLRGPRGAEERINSSGYRDREWSLAPSPGTTRVAVLGASVEYGLGVAEEDCWPRVLERELRSAEVMNFAVPGHTLEHMARTFEDHVRPFAPDVVVFSLGPHAIRPLVPRSDAVRYPLYELIQRSALHDLLRRVRDRAFGADELEAERALRSDPFGAGSDAYRAAARARLDALVRSLAAEGRRVVLVETPWYARALDPARAAGDDETSWEAWCRGRDDATFVPTSEPLRASMRALLDEARRDGRDARELWVRYGPATHALEHAGESAFFFDDPYHLTPAGHRVVARAVAAALTP